MERIQPTHLKAGPTMTKLLIKLFAFYSNITKHLRILKFNIYIMKGRDKNKQGKNLMDTDFR